MTKARMTIRRMEILKLIAKGFNNKQIAKKMKLSLSNTKFQKSRLYNCLGVHTAEDAIKIGKETGLI